MSSEYFTKDMCKVELKPALRSAAFTPLHRKMLEGLRIHPEIAFGKRSNHGWTRMDTDQNRNSPARIGSPKSGFLEQREDSFFAAPFRVNPYTYVEKFCVPAQILAARERKEHKEKELLLCDLCVLLRLSSLVAALPRCVYPWFLLHCSGSVKLSRIAAAQRRGNNPFDEVRNAKATPPKTRDSKLNVRLL